MRYLLMLFVICTTGCSAIAEDELQSFLEKHLQNQYVYNNSTQSGVFHIENATIHEAVLALADQYDVRVGVVFRLVDGAFSNPLELTAINAQRYFPGQKINARHTINIAGTLVEAVEAICKEYSGYTYEIEPDIVNIFPVDPTPFEIVLPLCSGNTDIQEELTKCYGILFAFRPLNANDDWPVRFAKSFPVEEPVFTVRNRTARQFLNMYVKREPYLCWVAEAGASGHIENPWGNEDIIGVGYAINEFHINILDSVSDEQVLEYYLNGSTLFSDENVEEEFFKRIDALLEPWLDILQKEPLTKRRWDGFWKGIFRHNTDVHMFGADQNIRKLSEVKRVLLSELAIKWLNKPVFKLDLTTALFDIARLKTPKSEEYINELVKGQGKSADTARRIISVLKEFEANQAEGK